MATSRQEKTYNEIIEYYNYADRLIKAAQDSSHNLASEQFVVIEEIVDELEKCADQLTTQYIAHVKSDESGLNIDSLHNILHKINAKIEECRNKILIIYQK